MENKEKDFKLANVIDKFEIARKKNKIQNTCFFNEQEILQVEKEIRMYNNYFFFGNEDDLIFFPLCVFITSLFTVFIDFNDKIISFIICSLKPTA